MLKDLKNQGFCIKKELAGFRTTLRVKINVKEAKLWQSIKKLESD